MKKIVFTTLLLIAISFSKASGQSLQESQKQSRYYTGIGVYLYQVPEGIIGFGGDRNGHEMRFNNKNGKFTGSVFLSRVLKNGPAGKAGLESGDMLVGIDGQNTSLIGVNGISQKIASKPVGGNVVLKVRQTDENGSVLREFDITVPVERIDRVSFVSLGLKLTGQICNSGRCFSYFSQVTEDKGVGRFFYRYEFTNESNEAVILRSAILDIMLRKNFSDPVKRQWKLDPYKTIAFVLESGDFPVESIPNPAQLFEHLNDDAYRQIKETNPNLESNPDDSYRDPRGDLWIYTMGSSFHLTVPEQWSPELTKRNEEFWKRSR